MMTTPSRKTIAVLRDFARFGLPEQIVSDNGLQFVSEEYESVLQNNGIKHIRSAPYHPVTNGAAERLVQTVKRAVEAGHKQGIPLEHTLATFLLSYNTSPHATIGVAPSTLLQGRHLCTRLDLLKPDIGRKVRSQ